MDLDDALETFILECRELLEDMETALLAVEDADEKSEMVNAIFRAAHTIKGSSGLFSLDHIVAFTHVVESVLDRVRGGKLTLSVDLVAVLLACCDHMGALVNGVAAGDAAGTPELLAQGNPLVDQLRAYLDGGKPAAAAVVTPAPRPSAAVAQGGVSATDHDPVRRMGGQAVNADHWHISVRFGPDVLRNGMDPLSFIRYLGTMGKMVGMATLTDALPDAQHMDPEQCYLGFEMAFQSKCTKADIEKVFEFVQGDCQLLI